MGTYFDGNLTRYKNNITAFRNSRSFTYNFTTNFELKKKLIKTLNQHFLLKRDKLGDQTREDDVETAGSFHLITFLMLPLSILGIFIGIRNKDQMTLICLCITLSTLAVFLSISFPQGRYIAILIPAYSYFSIYFLAQLTAKKTFLYSCFLLLTISLISSYTIITGPYNEFVSKKWINRDGIKDTLVAISQLKKDPSSRKTYIVMPNIKTYRALLYYYLVSNFDYEWVQKKQMKEMILSKQGDTNTLYLAFFSFLKKDNSDILKMGFIKVASLNTKIENRPIEIWKYKSPVINQSVLNKQLWLQKNK
jgi:hypothetical protein